MAAHSFVLRVARPKTFLGLMSLQTGTELVSLILLINKVIGFYGILTVVTGYVPSPLQLSLYISSLLVAVALGFLIRHIRKYSPLENLALAWLYLIDTVLNVAFTAAFAVNWYQSTVHSQPSGTAEPETAPAQDGAEERLQRSDGYAVQSGAPDTPSSMVLIVLLTLVRVYFSLVVMSYARMVLRRTIDLNAADVEEDLKGSSRNPFAVGSALGDGFRGRLGRLLVAIGTDYWLGETKEDEEWARAVKARFNRSARPTTTASVSNPVASEV